MLENQHAIIGLCLLFGVEVNYLIMARVETILGFNGAKIISENITFS